MILCKNSEVSRRYLEHESGNDTMKAGILESETFLSGAQTTEVFDGSWYNVRTQEHDDSAHRSLPDLDVEVNLRIFP